MLDGFHGYGLAVDDYGWLIPLQITSCALGRKLQAASFKEENLAATLLLGQ